MDNPQTDPDWRRALRLLRIVFPRSDAWAWSSISQSKCPNPRARRLKLEGHHSTFWSRVRFEGRWENRRPRGCGEVPARPRAQRVGVESQSDQHAVLAGHPFMDGRESQWHS